MLSEMIIVIISILLISQYGSAANFRRYERRENEYAITPLNRKDKSEDGIESKENNIIDLNTISLDDLRKLDKIYNGTEIRNRVYKTRKERIIGLRNESKRKFGLIDKIKSIDPNKIPLERLEKIVKIIGE